MRTARRVFIPLTVGGGIRSVADARNILMSGADKVSVNTAAVRRPELITELSEEFGAQAVVLAIDARSNSKRKLECFYARRPRRRRHRRRRVGARRRKAGRGRDPADFHGYRRRAKRASIAS